ncbi:hypothetical protein EFS29_10485 [Lactiplantibacillus plantarum]|nr:hypothetical protein [Lactiplantibacillus plantarum]
MYPCQSFESYYDCQSSYGTLTRQVYTKQTVSTESKLTVLAFTEQHVLIMNHFKEHLTQRVSHLSLYRAPF